jgi:excisionase family DNA binding protein
MTPLEALKIDEVAQRLRVRRDTVYGLIKAGLLQAFKLYGTHGEYRVSSTALADYIARQETQSRQL